MDMKRKKLYEKQKSVELREEDGSPHPKVCEHNEHKDTAGVCSREDSGANKSLEQLDVVQHVDFKNLQKECASNSQRQHTSSPLEPQKTQEACYLTDDDDKTRAEGDMNAGCTVHDAIDQRYGGIDAASYQSVAQKTHTKCSSQKRVATLPPSNKRPAKLIKVEFNVTIQGGGSQVDNLDAVKEEPDLPDAQREIGRSLGGSGEGSNDPSGSQQPVPSPESGPNNEDESTDIDSFVGSPRSGNYQEGHREGDMDRDHQHRQLRPKGCFNTVAGSKSLKRKSAAAINTKLPEGVQTNAPEPWKRKHGILSRPSNAAAQTTFDKRAALASRQATSELRELPASKPVSKLTKAGTAIEGTALEKLCQSRVYLSKFRQHYDLAHQHFVRQVNEIIQMTSVLERQEHQAAKSSGRQGRRSQIDMAPISRACTAAMGIMNSYAAPTAPPPSWLPQNYLTGPCTHHFMYPTLVPLPHLGNFGPRYTAMHPANAAFFRGGQAPFQGFHVNEVAPSKRPVPDAALKRQMRNGNSQFSSQQLVQMVPVDGEGQCGVAFPVSNLVG